MSKFNNTRLIKLRNTYNGLHATYLSHNNEDCIIEEVLEHREDECPIVYTQRVLYYLIEVIGLESRIKYGDNPKHLEINIVDEIQDCD